MRAVHGQVIKQRGLELAFHPGFAGIDDFQYPACIQASLQPVIAITLPIQGRSSARDIEEIFCKALGFACRKPRCRVGKVCHVITFRASKLFFNSLSCTTETDTLHTVGINRHYAGSDRHNDGKLIRWCNA